MPPRPAPRRALVLLAVAALAGAPTRAPAQYLFGQNKVIYTQKEWKVISTPRLDVYYYEGEQELAEYAADFAEKTCVEYETWFAHKFDQKIPLILYASHHDFKQTNVIDQLISEYVGGFTDLLRGRVAIPHTGSFTQLRRVLRHELTHAFMNDKLAHEMSARKRYNYVGPPLWFTEGLAEYVAMPEPETEGRMFLRDLVVNDNLVELQNLWRISGSFLMYKEGESLVGYIGHRFGDRALVQLLQNWWYSDRFDVVLHFTLGISVEDLNRDWKRYLKRRYYPAVMASDWPEQHGKALTKERGLQTRPAVYAASARPDGSCDFLFLSSASGSVDLVHARAGDRGKYDFSTLVRGERSDNVESIPAFSSGPEVHGSRVAFTSKSGDRDALFVWDIPTGKRVFKLKFDSLVALGTPSFSPDGSQVVLAGLDKSGWADLYRVRLDTGALERLTRDPADDRDPDWSPDGKHVAWSSDRDAPERNGVYHILSLDLETGEVTRLTNGDQEDSAPSWSPDGHALLFGSDLNGADNVYLYETETAKLTQVTSTLGGIFTPQWTPDGKAFLASSFDNTSFNVYRFEVQHLREVPEVSAQPQVASAASIPAGAAAPAGNDWIRSSGLRPFPVRNYDVKFGLDFVRTAVAFDPDFASGAGGQLGLTDLLGDHQIFVHASMSSDVMDQFFKHVNLGATYTNLSHRLHYSVGAFHLTSVYDPDLDLFRFERRFGALFGVSYPLSRFRRIETSFVGRVAQREPSDAALHGVGPDSFLFSTYTSFVHDNTMWSFVGPVDGMRLNVTLGQTMDFTGTRRGGTSAQLDLRRYQRLPARSVLATRLVARGNWGDDVHSYYLGGSWDMRGYLRRELFARRLEMFNAELRFPLVDRLLIGLPFNSIEFGGIRGALFSDVLRLGQGDVYDQRWFGSLGAGGELALGGGLIMRLDFGRKHDFHRLQEGFTDFFLGWDY